MKNNYIIWKCFNKFFLRPDHRPSEWEECLVLFVVYLVQSGRKSATVKSYISAIKAVLNSIGKKLNNDQVLLT